MSGPGPAQLVFNPVNPVTEVVERVPFGERTAVRKVLRPDGEVIAGHWTTSDDEDHWNLWFREDRAYTSGMVDVFVREGIRGPALLDRTVRDDGAVELWLEDVAGTSARDWTMPRHARFARRLGAAQARLARPGAAPQEPWLSRRWLRAYALSRPGLAAYDDPSAWEHPVVVEGFGDERHRIRARFGELRDDADRWLALMEALPRTLCHLDCWPNNALASDDGTDVLVDWAFVGDGCVGEDPGNWIPDAVFDHFVEPDDLGALEDAVWEGYAAGLDDADWPHPTEVARLGLVASAVKYVWLPGLMVERADHTGPTGYGGMPGHPLPEVFRRRLVVFDRLLDWLDEARVLADALRLSP